MTTVIETEWLSSIETVGFVLTYDDHDGFKVRCGVAKFDDETLDQNYILGHGAKIPFDWAWGIFGQRMVVEAEIRNPALNEVKSIRYDGSDREVNK